jgi:hypothetical protein
MNDTHPPRFAEALLESFGAEPGFCEAILGDLAQEHAQRAERYGSRAARLWYYKEAAMAMPHLLRNWLAGAGFADARRLLNVAALAYVLTMATQVALSLALLAVLQPFGTVPAILSTPAGRWLTGLVVVTLGPFCAGYLAAHFEERRPMLAALALAFLWMAWIVAGAVLWMLLPTSAPEGALVPETWTRIVVVPFIASFCVLGGALRVKRLSTPSVG